MKRWGEQAGSIERWHYTAIGGGEIEERFEWPGGGHQGRTYRPEMAALPPGA
jgi:hypothetical protein